MQFSLILEGVDKDMKSLEPIIGTKVAKAGCLDRGGHEFVWIQRNHPLNIHVLAFFNDFRDPLGALWWRPVTHFVSPCGSVVVQVDVYLPACRLGL